VRLSFCADGYEQSSVAPEWAQPLFHMLQDAQARLDSLDGGRNRIEAPPHSRAGGSQRPGSEGRS
jgi:hypothetical protein